LQLEHIKHIYNLKLTYAGKVSTRQLHDPQDQAHALEILESPHVLSRQRHNAPTPSSCKFWGQTENAVKTQIWIAVSVYALVAIAKKRFMIKKTLYEMLQIFSISIFEKMPINQLFQDTQLQYFKEQKHVIKKPQTFFKSSGSKNLIYLN
jgi:hypothetical protein